MGDRLRFYFLALTRNPLSLLGAALTTASAVLVLTLFGLDLVGYHGGPYVGILTYVLLPSVFVLGLLLIPLGAAWERRRARKALDRGEPPPRFPVVDLNLDRVRRAVLLFVVASAVNVSILAIATYKGVEVMESTEFCGTTCHTVMTPEYTAYHGSPHASVPCVACHVGSGAGSFAKSKLNGVRQLVLVALDRYPRPIPAPVADMRPARETCSACHTPANPAGDRLEVITRYAEDEKNSERKTVLLMKVGGRSGVESHGIHWHADPRVTILFRGKADRTVIDSVELRVDGKAPKTFVAPVVSPAADTGGERFRTMDCTDCHNRAGHVSRSPTDELDAAFARGDLDRGLPFLKREAMKALRESYASREEAGTKIPERVRAFYGESYPEQARAMAASISKAASVLVGIWRSNVFPDMGVDWGAYPSHLGHQNSPGCFRCHDGEHATSDGEAISQDCSTCHVVLAMDEENPAILGQLAP